MTVDWRGSTFNGPLHYTATISRSGTCVAAVHTGGDAVQMIETGQGLFMKSNAHFWTTIGGLSNAASLQGKWLFSSEPGSNSFASFCSRSDRLSAFTPNEIDGAGTVTKGRPTTVNGKPVVTLVRTDSDATTTIYVATEGVPYIVKAVTNNGIHPFTTTFSNFGVPLHVTAPPPAQTINRDSLS